MKKTPNITTVEAVIKSANETSTELNGKWVPARPLGYYSLRYRIKAALLVLTGQCDALRWPEGQ